MDTVTTIELIRSGDKKVFSDIYHSISNDCKSFIFKRGGSVQLAEEVLHEALYRFFVKVKGNPDFKLQKSIEKVVFGFIKNVWLEMTRAKKKEKTYLDLDDDESRWKDKLGEEEDFSEAFFQEDEQSSKLIRLMEKLGKDCKEVLVSFYVYKTSLEDIGEELGLKKDYVKLKRFRCLGELRKKYFA